MSQEAFESAKPYLIEPVKVKGRGRVEIITTYALLDNGSKSNWCSEGLAKNLGVAGPCIPVSLSTIEKDSKSRSCSRISLGIMDMNELNMIELNIASLRRHPSTEKD